jgi:alcohol dehydrogenase (cytochrome c)
MVAGVTPTAGGVVFTGSANGDFLALDAGTGAVLYRFNTGGAVGGGVSTYAVDGRQYVAVASGNASRTIWKTRGAATIVVFGLPQGGRP